MASTCKVYSTSNRTDAFIAGITIDDDAVPAITNLDTICEQPSAVFSFDNRDARTIKLYKKWDCKAQFGPSPLDNDTLQGNATANPTEIQAFTVFFRPSNGTIAETTFFSYMIVIEYDTIWHELRAMTGS
jgi:hypothetical protein